MSWPYRIGLVACVLAGVFVVGTFVGRQYGREAALKAAVSSYQTRERINHETENLDAHALCLALGGLQHECTALLRGLDTAAAN